MVFLAIRILPLRFNDYQKIDSKSWYKHFDGPLISHSNEIDRQFKGAVPIAVERQNGPFLWEKLSENHTLELFRNPIIVSPTSVETRLLLGNGWHNIQTSHVWSEDEADLNVPLAKLQNNEFGMRISFNVFNASQLSPKRVLVKVEDVQVAEWNIHSGKVEERVVPLDSDLLGTKTSEVQVHIRVPEATSPEALGLSSDSRILGINLREIEFLQGSDFRKAFRIDNYQPPQGLNWEAENKNIPTQFGKKVSGAVLSTDQSGFLVYGPYVSMKAGSYLLEIRGINHSNKGRVITDVVSNKGKHTFASFEELDAGSSSDSKVLLNKEVVLDEAVSDLEVRVWVDELADIELHGYSLRSINDTVKPFD